MAYITVGSTFTPFSYDEKVRPFIQYNEAFDALEDKYLTMQEKAAQIGSLIDPETAPEAYRIYQNYQNSIQRAFDDLYANGITSNNKNMLGRIRNEQVPELTALTSDIARSEKAKEAFYKNWYGKEHDFIGRNPYDIPLDEWLDGKTPDSRGISSSELSTYVAAGVKAASERAYQVYDDNGYMVTKKGLSQPEVDYLMDALTTGYKFDNSTSQGRYLNKVLDDVIEFIDTDVYSRFGLNDEDKFTKDYQGKIDAAINYGLRIGFTHDQKATPITTKGGDGGGGGGGEDPILNNLKGAKAGVSLYTPSSRYSAIENNTALNTLISKYNVGGKDLIVDYRTYKNLLEEYNKKYDEYEDTLAKYAANVRIAPGKSLEMPKIKEPDRTLVSAFEDALGKDAIATIQKAEKENKITFNNSKEFLNFYSDYRNRMVEIPSIEIVGPSVNNDLRSAMSENIYTQLAGTNQLEGGRKEPSLIRKTDGYEISDFVDKKELKDILGENGENILQLSINMEGLFADPNNAYALITTESGNYYIPMQFINPSFANIRNIVLAKMKEAGITNHEEFRSWNDKNHPELLKKTNDIINGLLPVLIRDMFNTPYYTASPSKGHK